MALLRAKLKCADICPRTLCVPRNLQFSERDEQRAGKILQEFFSVLKYDLMNRHICSSSATTRKHFSSLELNSKRRFIVLDVRFEKWEISPGIYLWTFPSFSRGIFG